uniref:Uncharacterized protein n=1 Tax=Bactrocera dorsalis TaxID=27457 RepID=A0A034W7K7_BACDO
MSVNSPKFRRSSPSLSKAVKQASIAEPFGSSITIGGVGESILTEMSACNQILYRQESRKQTQQCTLAIDLFLRQIVYIQQQVQVLIHFTTICTVTQTLSNHWHTFF